MGCNTEATCKGLTGGGLGGAGADEFSETAESSEPQDGLTLGHRQPAFTNLALLNSRLHR